MQSWLRVLGRHALCFSVLSLMVQEIALGSDRDTRVRSLYLKMEDVTKEATEKDLLFFERHRKRPATSTDSRMAREAIYLLQYQRLVDYLACATHVSTPEEVTPCIARRSEMTSDMLHFQMNNAEAIAKHDAPCAAKTRMTTLERKYPPYDFMHKNAGGFRAVDAKAYLECIKQRL